MWVYLSPHPDDAAYSCGGLLWTQVQAGEDVTVWTLFAGDPPSENLSPFARRMHELWKIEPGTFADRRTEDEKACALLGTRYRHETFVTCLYRRGGARNRPLYPTPGHMFGYLSRSDRGLVEELADMLRGALPSGARVVAPLGLGNHVDHVLTRLVAERLDVPLTYYEDFPYALEKPDRNDKVLAPAWESRVFSLSAEALEAWQAAVATYASQLEICWKTESAMRDTLKRHLEMVGGVRLWRRTTARPAPARITRQDAPIRWLLAPFQMAPISPVRPMAGAVSSIIELAESLRRTGDDVTIAGTLSEGRDVEHNGVAYRHLAVGDAPERALSSLSNQRYDVIVAQRGHVLEHAARFFPFAVRLLRVVDVYFDAQRVPPDIINRRVDAVMAGSRFVKGALVEWGIHEQNVGVIYNGLNTDRFYRDPAIAREDKLIVFAGATISEKGLPILLQACRRLMRDDPDLRLEVYGSVGLWQPGEETIDWPKITAQTPGIVHRGAVGKDEIAHAFNRAALCVFPSDPAIVMEGFGRVSLEAQGCGCPVIVSRSGGMPETVLEGETGLVVAPLDERTLADAIAGLLADKEKREAMGRRAEEHAKRFTADDSARAVRSLAETIRKAVGAV